MKNLILATVYIGLSLIGEFCFAGANGPERTSFSRVALISYLNADAGKNIPFPLAPTKADGLEVATSALEIIDQFCSTPSPRVQTRISQVLRFVAAISSRHRSEVHNAPEFKRFLKRVLFCYEEDAENRRLATALMNALNLWGVEDWPFLAAQARSREGLHRYALELIKFIDKVPGKASDQLERNLRKIEPADGLAFNLLYRMKRLKSRNDFHLLFASNASLYDETMQLAQLLKNKQPPSEVRLLLNFLNDTTASLHNEIYHGDPNAVLGFEDAKSKLMKNDPRTTGLPAQLRYFAAMRSNPYGLFSWDRIRQAAFPNGPQSNVIEVDFVSKTRCQTLLSKDPD